MPVASAQGAVLAHSVGLSGGVFKKGRVLSAADVALLAASGVTKVFAARLGPDDVPEDEAARALAARICGVGASAQEPFTGRANLYSQVHGLVVVDSARVNALNRIHESITFATVAGFSLVDQRQMIATVKIIPFAVPRKVLDAALAVIAGEPLVRVDALKAKRVGLVITRLPRSKTSLLEKSEHAMRQRVSALGSDLAEVMICDHSIEAVKNAAAKLKVAGCDPILLFGASAIVDRGDVIPMGLVAAGGEVIHLGMPVDPGNLMMLGSLQDIPVIGVPSCARSPKVNGFDWALQRVLAGIPVSSHDIMDMGAGGLLAEISSRPAPREGQVLPQHAPKVAAIVLAAGKSSRMGSNKLLADFDGKPLLRHGVENIKQSDAQHVVVVTGNEAEHVKAALRPLAVNFVHNENFANGLSTSLKCGLAALPPDVDAVLICLGDMPLVDSQTINRLISSFNVGEHRTICVPVHDGKRGNPVLWGRQHFPGLQAIEGDQGGRLLMDALSDEMVEVDVKTGGVLVDVDTPQALAEIRSVLNP